MTDKEPMFLVLWAGVPLKLTSSRESAETCLNNRDDDKPRSIWEFSVDPDQSIEYKDLLGCASMVRSENRESDLYGELVRESAMPYDE
jgi:hypothetical protein